MATEASSPAACLLCGLPIEAAAHGPRRLYHDACRKRAWRERNAKAERARCAARKRERRATDPDYRRSEAARMKRVRARRVARDPEYRAREASRVVPLVREARRALWRRLHARQGGLCAWCGEPLPAEYDGTECNMDHWMPRRVGGPDDESNRRAMHARCNRAKGGAWPVVAPAEAR